MELLKVGLYPFARDLRAEQLRLIFNIAGLYPFEAFHAHADVCVRRFWAYGVFECHV
jgi:hypothetical protein